MRRTPVSLDEVLREAVASLDGGRAYVYQILAAVQSEHTRVERSLALTEQASVAAAEEAAAATAQLARARAESNLEAVAAAALKLGAAQARALWARERRAECSAIRERMGRALAQVEALVDKVSAAVDFFAGHVAQVTLELEGLRARFEVGERVIGAQEEERRRIAREIHDGPAQAMANVVLRTEICERLLANNRPEIRQELAQLKQLVKESLREVRTIIFNLRPMALDDLGLVPTLRRYLGNLVEQEHVPVRLCVRGEERRLPSVIEVAAFRLVQEAVNNARKYARAERIAVEIWLSDDDLEVSVTDDGVGFDVREVEEQQVRRERFGLISMRERVQLLGGEFLVESTPGRGTRVRARIPFTPGKSAEGANPA